MSEFAGMGFAPGVVRGVRSFRIDKLGRLTGIHYEQVWRPGENAAECRKRDDDLFMNAYHRVLDSYLHRTWTSASTAPSTGGFWRGRRDVPVQVPAAEPPCDPPHQFEMCKCGFYAYYDGSDDYHQEGYVSGVVEGYGETLIGTRGFRAMKSRIVAMHIPEDVPAHLSRRVASNYSMVPQFQSFADMVAEFEPDAAGAAVTPESDPGFWDLKL